MSSMNERYEPKSIEPRWQKRWEDEGVFRAGRRPGAEKRYVLEMFPYPSGAMHMGHARVYTIGDALARLLRMRGYDVLHPMGFDALGLPAENAALKDGRHPDERTRENIDAFRADMKRVGFAFDWSREFATCDAEYYRWNQWFFLRMLEKGIVYRRQGKANWCTGCQTVIANEQVVDENVCERCSSPVVEKVIPEWAFRITDYADDLLDGLDGLREWPERITTMQRNWIGRSLGAEAEFAVEGSSERIRVFTTRLDTIFGCSYVVLAPEHPLTARLTTPERRAEVTAFVDRMATDGRRGAHRRVGAQGGGLHRGPRRQSLQRPEGPGLDRQLRAGRIRHRRGDERAGPRPARPRVRAEVLAPGPDRHPASRGDAPDHGRGAREGLHRGRRARRTRAPSPGCPAPRPAAACRRSRRRRASESRR